MKNTGKGKGIEFTSHMNKWKMQFAEELPKPEFFKPLQVKEHPRAAEMAAFRAIPSRWY